MTPAQLKKAETRYKAAVAKADELRQARNVAVRGALAEGWTHAQVAEVLEVTRGRIGQLAGPVS